MPIAEALEYLAPVVDDVVLVSEASLRQAMSILLDTTGLVGEPAGVAGIAALIEHPHLRSGRDAAVRFQSVTSVFRVPRKN